MARKKANPKMSPETRLRAASRAVADDRPAEAERLLRPLIGKTLDLEDQAALAALLRETQHEEADATLQRAEALLAELPTEDASARLRAAQALTLLGREDDALASLSACLSMDAANTRAGTLALRLHLSKGDAAAGLATLEPVFAALPAPRRFMLNAVKAIGVAGYASEALALLDRATAQDKTEDPEAAFIRAGLEGREAAGQGEMAAQVFDSFAETYDDNLARIDNNGPAMIGELLARLRLRKGAVLDAGCGTGLCAPVLRPYARALTGCDISIPMLEKAKDKRGYDALLRSDLGAPVTLPPGPFDLIVAADVLTYFGDLTPVLRGLSERLAPGGWIVFTVEEAKEGPPYALAPTGRYRHSADGVASMLTAAGLTKPKDNLRDRLRTEFGQPVGGLAVAAQKLALLG